MEKLIKETAQDDNSCLYCGQPIYRGEVMFWSDDLDSAFCSRSCHRDYIEFAKSDNKTEVLA